MKHLLPLFVIIFLASCAKDIQVVTVSSPILQNDTLLRQSNDTFEIVYNLFDENGLVSFSIYNKSNVPLYVDWKRSAYIVGTQKTDFWEDRSDISMVTTGRNIDWLNWYGRTKNYTTGSVVKPEQVTFIPPKTSISMARFRIGGAYPVSDYADSTLDIKAKKKHRKAKTRTFTETNTPKTFRNFLTLSLKHDFSQEFYVDHSFWVNHIMVMNEKTFAGPMQYEEQNGFYYSTDYSFPYSKPNRFYLKPVYLY